MANIIKFKGIITSVKEYLNDLVLFVATKEQGNITVIAKNANSPNSKRGALLKAGTELTGVLYYRNHYYLSSIENIKNLYAGINNWYGVKLFKFTLKALEEHWDVYSTRKYTRLVNFLEMYSKVKSKANLFAITFALFYELFLITTPQLRCAYCGKKVIEGYFVEGALVCNKCLKMFTEQKSFKFHLKHTDGQIDFFSKILDYWSF